MSMSQTQQVIRKELFAQVWVVPEPRTDLQGPHTRTLRGEGLSHAWGKKGASRVCSPGSQTWFQEFEEAKNCKFEPVLQFVSRVRIEEIASNSLSAEYIASKHLIF